MRHMTMVQVGSARVAVLNAGDLRLDLAEELALPEALWRPQYADLFEQSSTCPTLSIYIEHDDARVLVDINDYRSTVTPDSRFALAGYVPPAPIPAQLASLGVQPEDINHVVITHTHWDHYAGTTSPAESGYAPTFPRARYYLGVADWRDAELQMALRDQTSLQARTLGVLWDRGLLHLVEGWEQIAEGIDILPAPGESPGHQIVQVQSQGETLYVIGDLFDHVIEIEHPDWMATWADSETMRATRHWLLQEALATHALLIAAHIAAPGYIERSGNGLRWSDA